MTYDNTNRGAMWANRNKGQDSDRDYQGEINIDGVDYWLSGYRRPKDGNPNAPAVKFTVKRKDEVHVQGMQPAHQ